MKKNHQIDAKIAKKQHIHPHLPLFLIHSPIIGRLKKAMGKYANAIGDLLLEQ